MSEARVTLRNKAVNNIADKIAAKVIASEQPVPNNLSMAVEVSDDRLRTVLRMAENSGCNLFSPEEYIIVCRELLSRRKPVEAGELVPVATLIEDGTFAVPDGGELEALFAAMPEVPHGGVKTIDVVPASALTASQARVEELERERDGLRRALIESGRAAGGFLADTVSSEFLSHVPTEVRALSTRLQEAEKALEEAEPRWLDDEQLSDEMHTELKRQSAFSIERHGKVALATYPFGKIVWDAFRRARSALKGEAS